MVTLENRTHPLHFRGKSTDTKPTKVFNEYSVKNGDEYFEFNTGKVFIFDEEITNWKEVGADA